jgi:hypothetical protein
MLAELISYVMRILSHIWSSCRECLTCINLFSSQCSMIDNARTSYDLKREIDDIIERFWQDNFEWKTKSSSSYRVIRISLCLTQLIETKMIDYWLSIELCIYMIHLFISWFLIVFISSYVLLFNNWHDSASNHRSSRFRRDENVWS